MDEMVIYVNGAHVELRNPRDLTTGMEGMQVAFQFDASWDGMSRTAVFRCGDVTKDVLDVRETVVIPPEVLHTAGGKLYIGVYGTNEDGTVVIPTRWVLAGPIYAGTDPSGDTTTESTLAVWAQLQTQIGRLEELETEDRSCVVNAVNEVKAVAQERVPTTEIQSAVDRFMVAHQVEVEGLVAYDGAQALTDAQQAQARKNIGAGDMKTLLGKADREEVFLQAPGYVRTAAGAVAEKMLGVTGEASTEVETAGGYTNLLPLAIDTDGSIFNGSGYITGYRLNSSGAVKEITESYYDAAVCATGFIPCQAGDIIRLQGMVIDPADTQAGSYNIHVYNSSFASVGFTNWAILSNNATVTTDENGYISSITLNSTLGSSEVAYMRLSAKNITADSIVTVNEEITSGGTNTVDASVIPFSMAFLTDLHWNDADESRYEAAAQALRVIAETGPLDLVCFGGDYIYNWSEETAANAREDIARCRKTFSDLPVPVVWLRGNHENNGYDGQRLTRPEIFQRISRAQNTLPAYVSNPADPYGCYGYLDFDNARVRVIAVNTSDNDVMGTSATAVGNTAELINCHNIAAAQLQWIADKALDLTDKEEPKKWTILVLSHIPIYSENSWYNAHTYTDGDGNTWTCNVVNLETLMAAYRDGGSFSISLNGETASGDFSGTAAAGNILFVNGHGHSLNQVTHNGFVYITCPNFCNNGEKASADGVVYTKGDAGTAEEISFNILTVDPANRKVHAWIYGAGYDRTLDF